MSRPSKRTVIDLFSHSACHKRLRTRIEAIIGAIVKNGQLYVELGLIGPEPPRDWLCGLICVIRYPVLGIERSARIERVTSRDGDRFLVRTMPLSHRPSDGTLPVGTTLIIRSDDGVICSKTFDTFSDQPSA